MLDPTADRRTGQFDAIVAKWDEVTRCELPTQAGPKCRRAAHWRINLHGCEQGHVCTQHLRAWTTAAEQTSTGRCTHCGRQFDQITDAYTVTRL
jgi:hypothetical protein